MRTPVGFTHFLNSHFDLQKTTNFQCNYFVNSKKKYLGLPFCLNTTSIKMRVSKLLNPYKSENRTCAVMLHTNLVDPQWILIDCQIKLFSTIYCMKSKLLYSDNTLETNQNSIEQDRSCLPSCLRKLNKCYLFIWKDYSVPNLFQIKPSLTPPTTTDGKLLHNIFDALLAPFPPIVQHKDTVLQLKPNHMLQMVGISLSKLGSQSQTQGFQIFEKNLEKIIRGSNLFQCKYSPHISSNFICDVVKDCLFDESDELNCVNQVKAVTNCPRASCSPLHYISARGLCSKYMMWLKKSISQRKSICHMKPTNSTLCQNGARIESSMHDDLVADCGPNGEDEPTLIALITQQIEHDCKNKFQIACFPGHSKCFNVTDICVYKLDKFKHVGPCRNGGHMASCANFECNHHYKCVLSYCILWSYVCDGKWDCPNGDEEKYGPVCGTVDAHKCLLMYKCRRTNVLCLHPHSVCDGKPNCPFQDDEMLCALHNILCPKDCSCLFFAMSCNHVKLSLFVDNYPHIFLSVYQSNLPLKVQMLFAKFQLLMHILITKTNISEICMIKFAQSLLDLNATYNRVRSISTNCLFSSMKLLKLDLSRNSISSVQSHSFKHLSEIKYLDLSFNPLTLVLAGTHSAPQNVGLSHQRYCIFLQH